MMNNVFITKNYARVKIAKEQGFTTVSLQGSSRSAKTYSIVQFLCIYCSLHPKTTVSIVRAGLPSLKRSVYRDFKEIMLSLNIWNDKQMNKSDLIYTFPNGSTIEFFSTDNEQKIRGSKRKILFVNEANELDFLQWQQLQMRTTDFSIIDYNPSFTDDHWICEINQEASTYWFISTYKDNPFLEEKVIKEIESLKDKNPSLWRIYGLGLQSVVEGLIFENVKELKDDYIPLEKRKHHYRGMDFGYTNDPTAIIDVYICGDELWLDEICYKTKMLSSDIIKEIKNANNRDRSNVETISESADPRLIDELNNAGLDIKPVKKYAGSIIAGINKMQTMKIFYTSRSVNLKKEFNNYTYRQNKDGKWLNEPIDSFNHGIDAVRYVVLEKLLGKDENAFNAQDFLNLI